MPRSSRHKQQKQTKHSSRDVRERSDSEEDGYLKSRNGGDEITVRVSRDSASGEKRKIVSQSRDGNGDYFEDYVVPKRRKEGVDATGTDRRKGIEEEREKRDKIDEPRFDSEKSSKMKVLVDSNSTKSGRRNDSSTKEKNSVVVIDSAEVQKNGSSKVESKYKSEKDLPWKEVHPYKDGKEKERGADRDRKVRDLKRERSVDAVPGRRSNEIDLGRKQGSQSGHVEGERSRKRESEHDKLQLQDDLPNADLEKELEKQNLRNADLENELDKRNLRNADLENELEKRIRSRRGDSGEKDKYQDDASDGINRGLSLKEDRAKTGKDKDERSDRDKYMNERYRDKYREDVNRDGRQRDDKRRDERSSRDHAIDRYDIKHFRDESKTDENRQKKSRPQNGDRDGSPYVHDRGTRYKDSKENKRSSKDNEGYGDFKSLRTPERHSDVEKKPLSTRSHADMPRSQSRHVDGDSTVSSSKWKTSPNSSAHSAKDQYRYNSKQADSKYRDSISEERVRSSINYSRELTGLSGVIDRPYERRSLEKPIQKDEKLELPHERSRRLDAQASPKQLMEKSPSLSSIDRRYSNRSTLRRSLDVDEVGGRNSGSKDARDYCAGEDRRSRDFPSEKPSAHDFSQVDGDTKSVSSSYNRASHMPGNSSSLLPPPPPPRTGVDSPAVLDEDSRGKSSNRYRRYGDPNVGRGMGNAWKAVPSWPSQVPNGFIPYPHVPPPGGFHPVMQQFPAHLFGIRSSMDLSHTGLPYHISDVNRFSAHGRSYGWRNPSDGACPPHLHGWDVSNGVFGDEPQMHGTQDWDQNRHLMSGRGWETNTEMWKGQNSGVDIELPPAAQKEDHLRRVSSDELRPEQSVLQPQTDHDRPGSQVESVEIKQSSSTSPEKESSEAFIESSKKSDNGGSRFCHVYLSKFDISADLSHPEMYNQCMRLLGEENASIQEVVSEHDYVEERTEAGVKISNTIESTSFFPKINESIFQRAMALYVKQTEEIKVKPHFASLPYSKKERVPNTEVVKLEPVPTTNEEISVPSTGSHCENLDSISAFVQNNAIDPIPASSDEKLEEQLVNQDQEMAEKAVPMSDQEMAEEVVPMSDQEIVGEPVPMSVQVMAEAVLVSDQERTEAVLVSNQERSEETFPASNKDNAEEEPSTPLQSLEEIVTVPVKDEQEETDLTSVKEKVEPVLEVLEVVEQCSSHLDEASLTTPDSPCVEEETNRASECKGNHVPEEHKAFSDAICGSVGISEGCSEGCEVLMPESIECRLVSQSRIHNFPENTH